MDRPGHEGEGVPEAVRVRRVLVALDSSGHSRQALVAAAHLAGLLEAELEGVFVEEDAWYGVGSLGTARVIRSYTGTAGRLEAGEFRRELAVVGRRLARLLEEISTRRKLRWHFRVERGRADKVITGAAREVDLVTLGRTGLSPGKAGRLGRTARALMEESETPLLLLQEGMKLGQRMVLVYDGTPGSERGLRMASRLVTRQGTPLEVVVPSPPGPAADELVGRLKSSIGGPPGDGAKIHLIPNLTADDLARIIGVRADALVLASRGSPLFHADRRGETLLALRCPLLLF